MSPTVVAAGAAAYEFSAELPSLAVVEPGESFAIETLDARAGALLERPRRSSFPLERATPGASNPLTGPVAVAGARPGDRVVVTVDAIELGPAGWCGAHAHVGPLRPGRIPEPLGRVCDVRDTGVDFGDGIELPLTPMLGCLGVAAAGVPNSAGVAGRHGGNLDHRPLAPGARIHLPVFAEGALLYAGDVHAAQGDGELAGTALECPATVRLRASVERGGAPEWPWIETDERVMVLTAADTFEEARAEAVDAVVSALESRRGLAPAEALALVSLAGDLRIGQAFGGPQLTLRLEIPKSLLPGGLPFPTS